MKTLYTKWRETRQQESGKRVPLLPRACCPWRAGQAGCKSWIHGAGGEQQCTNRMFLRGFLGRVMENCQDFPFMSQGLGHIPASQHQWRQEPAFPFAEQRWGTGAVASSPPGH